jgi:1,2-diacylglycerol 3-alpha-glucosyltransferase
MRIGIFSDFSLPHIGGVETSIFHQQRALSAAGHEVFVISPPQKGADTISDQVEKVLRVRSPVPIYFDGMGIYYFSPGIEQKIDQLKLEVVHVQSEYNTGSLGIKYARKHNLPLLYTAHTFYPPQIEQFMSLPKTMAVLATIGQKTRLGKYRAKQKFSPKDNFVGIPCHTFAQRRIFDVWMKFAASTDAILAPSKRMMSYIDHFIADKPVYYLPNPFASMVTDEETFSEPVHQPIRFLTTSVMRPEKRPDVLIRAVALLKPHERAQMSLQMYGGGKLLPDLKRMLRRYGLKDYVQLHGSVDNRVIQRALMHNDVVISMSVSFDNQPMVILEGLHAGNAIVYCDPYLTEGTHGENAILTEPTSEGVANTLRKIISDPEGVAILKRNSKQLASQFTYDTFVDNYNAVLEKVAKK